MWDSIKIYTQQIKAETEKSVLISLPKNSQYDGFVFWHPSKLVREFQGMKTFSFNEEFKFRLKKYGKGKYNSRELVEEIEVGTEEIIDAFSNQSCLDGIEDVEPIIYTPETLIPEQSCAIDELIDND